MYRRRMKLCIQVQEVWFGAHEVDGGVIYRLLVSALASIKYWARLLPGWVTAPRQVHVNRLGIIITNLLDRLSLLPFTGRVKEYLFPCVFTQ